MKTNFISSYSSDTFNFLMWGVWCAGIIALGFFGCIAGIEIAHALMRML